MYVQGGPKKPDHFLKCMTPVYDEVGRRSIYQTVELFIRSETNIRNVAIFKYYIYILGIRLEKRYFAENTD